MALQQNPAPTRKVKAVSLVNALVFAAGYVLRDIFGWEVTPDMQALMHTVLTALVGYYTPPSDQDGITSDAPAVR